MTIITPAAGTDTTTRVPQQPSRDANEGEGEGFAALLAQRETAAPLPPNAAHIAQAASPFAQLHLFQTAPGLGPADLLQPQTTDAASLRLISTAQSWDVPFTSAPAGATHLAASPRASQIAPPKPTTPATRRLAGLPSAPAASQISQREPPPEHLPVNGVVKRPNNLRTTPNPVFVALHATDGDLSVYARAGRMAPTERARLRNSISTLLAEYGHFDVRVNFNEQSGGAQWLK